MAEYQGRKVTLNKPMRGDVKKFKVYVKNAKGNVVKVNFVIGYNLNSPVSFYKEDITSKF